MFGCYLFNLFMYSCCSPFGYKKWNENMATFVLCVCVCVCHLWFEFINKIFYLFRSVSYIMGTPSMHTVQWSTYMYFLIQSIYVRNGKFNLLNGKSGIACTCVLVCTDRMWNKYRIRVTYFIYFVRYLIDKLTFFLCGLLVWYSDPFSQFLLPLWLFAVVFGNLSEAREHTAQKWLSSNVLLNVAGRQMQTAWYCSAVAVVADAVPNDLALKLRPYGILPLHRSTHEHTHTRNTNSTKKWAN